jgi:hypothetical protein
MLREDPLPMVPIQHSTPEHHSVDLCGALRSAPAGNPAEYRPGHQAGAARIIKIEDATD